MRLRILPRVRVYKVGCPAEDFKWLCDKIGIDTNRSFVELFEKSVLHVQWNQRMRAKILIG